MGILIHRWPFNIKNRLLSHEETHSYLKELKPHLKRLAVATLQLSCAGEGHFQPSTDGIVGPGTTQAVILDRTHLPTRDPHRHLDLGSQTSKWPVRKLVASRNNWQHFKHQHFGFLREARQASVLESWCLFKHHSHVKAAHRACLTIPWNPWQSDFPPDKE